MTTESNVIAMPNAKGQDTLVRRVDPFAHMRILIAEADRLECVLKFRKATRGMIETVNRIDQFIEAKSAEFHRAHERHMEFALRGHHGIVPVWMYWLAIVLVSALEVPLNNHALQALRMDEWETIGVAMGVGLLNTFAGSILGTQLRHALAPSRWKDVLMVGVVVVVIGASIYGLTDLRSAFLEFKYMKSPVVHSSPLAFVTLQVLFFAVATALCYFTKPDSPEFDNVLKDKRVYGSQLNTLWKARGSLAKKFNFRLAEAETRIEQCALRALRQIAEYRYENARLLNHGVPSIFNHAVGREVFKPISLEQRIDHDPKRIDQIVKGMPT